MHRDRQHSADDRSARRGAAAAGGRQVRHRGVRVDQGRAAPATATVKAGGGPGQAGRRPAPPGRASRASVNPEGQATTVFFQYGIDARFRPGGGPAASSTTRARQPQTLPADSTNHTVTAGVTGLVPNALYHVRVWSRRTRPARRWAPTRRSRRPPTGRRRRRCSPRTVDAKPVSGKVFLLVGGKLVPLTEGDQLRAGTVVDTRNGSLAADYGLIQEAQATDRHVRRRDLQDHAGPLWPDHARRWSRTR